MNRNLTISMHQLSSLIGSLGFPDPDGDFNPHGPGAPVIRRLAQARFVASSVVEWAVKLAEICEASCSDMIGKGPPTTERDCDPQELDMIGKGPPTNIVLRMIAPGIARFADDYCGTGSIRLPLPIRWPWPLPDPDPNPWQFMVTNERERTLGLLLTGAQFHFAALATERGALSELFATTSHTLLEGGLDGFEK